MKNSKIIKILFCFIPIFLILFLFIFNDQIALRAQAYLAVKKSIGYIFSKQLENGSFDTAVCKDEKMDDCISNATSFTSSIVLSSVDNIKIEKEKRKKILEKGTDFLLRNQEPDGTWHYWANYLLKNLFIPTDVDDTVSASYILSKNNIQFIDNKEIINKNKNEDGLFLTYIGGDFKEVDCVVNINALLYLQSNDPKICAYINDSLAAEKSCSPYSYADKLTVYYFLSRAYANGITCLGDKKNMIISSVLNKQNKDGSFGNDLQNGLAVNTLLNMDHDGPEIKKGISFIIKKQKKDGSWDAGSFWLGLPPYRHNGSAELTTAINSEALEKYLFKL